MMVVCNTPNGREIREVNGKFEVQPHNDNYWLTCDSVAEAMYRFHFPHGSLDARRIATMIVDSWGSQWSIDETARVGVSEIDQEAATELGGDELSAAVIVEIESICRERAAV